MVNGYLHSSNLLKIHKFSYTKGDKRILENENKIFNQEYIEINSCTFKIYL